MPVPLPQREDFIRTLRDNSGRPIEVREWVRENVYKPLDGFKVWPRGKRLCEKHAAEVGTILPKRALCRAEAHEGCDGLRGFKILVVCVDVSRQDGKTTGIATYELSDLVYARNAHALYLAAAEGQSDRVFDQKFLAMLGSNQQAKAQIVPGMDSLRNLKRNNSFIYVPTSAKSIASGSYRLLLVDEVRSIDPEVVMILLPSILSETGVECPHGHHAGPRPPCPKCREPLEGFECDVHGLFEAPKCPACGVEEEEYFGRAVLCSSAGDDVAFWTDLVASLQAEPDPNWHLFSTNARLNPHKSKETHGALSRVLTRIPGIEGMVNRELNNVPGGRGDEFLGPKLIESITDPTLRNLDVYEGPCLGFIDCSLTTDLTSLVVVGDFTDAEMKLPPWSTLATIRIDVFDPKDQEQFPNGRVRYRRDPNGGVSLEQHLEEFVGRFPGLLELWIDTTLLDEARDLFLWTQEQPWRGKVLEYPPPKEKELVKQLIWDSLEIKTLEGPRGLRIQKHHKLVEELKQAKTKVSEWGIRKVVDSGKGNRRGKRRMHRDVSMSLAGCCWRARILSARATAGNTEEATDRLNKLSSRFRSITAGMRKRNW